MPRSSIVAVERARFYGHLIEGGVLGLLGGALAGGALGSARTCSSVRDDCFKALGGLAGGVVGGVVGLVAGAIVGSQIESVEWQLVPLPQTVGRFGRREGATSLALSVRFAY